MHDAKENMLVCRCEEVTYKEIAEAVSDGARDINGVKLRTRAGMGSCQGRTCEKLVSQIICEILSENSKTIGYGTPRPPYQPVSFGVLAGEDGENR